MNHRFLASGMLLCGVFVSGAARAESNGISNSCSDPYWQNSLRCKVLQIVNPMPMPPPQPVPAPPANVNQIKPFTRVDLTADTSIRCVDGTRPIIYVDKAVGPPSNRWLIAMTGGKYCAAGDLDGLPGYENGNECVKAYHEEQGNLMGTAAEDSMSTLSDDNGNGIMSDDVLRNPLFARYNRVRVHKCGYDRHSGRATHLGVTAQHPLGGPSFSYDLYNHGQKIVLAAFDALAAGDGLDYATWIDVGGNVSATVESLPSIAAAEQVILVGHSGAAHGLYQNADRYADYLRALPGFAGDVRVVHDSQWMSAIENEAAFDPAQNPDPLLHNTLFEQRTSGHTDGAGDYDSFRYHGDPDSEYARDYPAWSESPGALGDLLDASCVATHTPSNDVWKCVDRFHVRLHHESTPALMREDYADPGNEHMNVPYGHLIWAGELGVYPHCDGVGQDYFPYSPCVPVIDFEANRDRLYIQARHFRERYFTHSELATGADTSAAPGSVFVWMPECGTHDSIYSDEQFLGTRIFRPGSSKSYREFLQDFAAAPAQGVIEYRVTHLDGALSECAPLLKDSFE